jgi:hypothetical protein
MIPAMHRAAWLALALVLLAQAVHAQRRVAAPTPVEAGTPVVLPPSPVTWTTASPRTVAITMPVGEGFYLNLGNCRFARVERMSEGGRQFWGRWPITVVLPPAGASCSPVATPLKTVTNYPPDVRMEAAISLTSSDPSVMFGIHPAGMLASLMPGRVASTGVKQAVLAGGQVILLREGRALCQLGTKLVLMSDGTPVAEWPMATSVVVLESSGQVGVRERLGAVHTPSKN